jgi:ferredoxin
MNELIHDKCAQLLADEKVKGILALREQEGMIVPYVFTSAEETNSIVTEPKWPLAKTAWRIALSLPGSDCIGLVCRSCDIRAIEELVKAGQVRPTAVRTIGIACSAEQASACLCDTPYPPGEEPSAGINPLGHPEVLKLVLEPGRFDLWKDHFSRCIKCYGCRNACPVCFCPSCKLEDDAYVTLGSLPPDPLAFHLIRAMHVADRCVGCGACQESCPSGLPLLSLHLAMRDALRKRTGYTSGSAALSPLLTIGREQVLSAAPLWEDTIDSRKTGGGRHAG